MSNRGVCLGVALDIKYFFQLFKVLFNDLPSELIRIPWAIKKAMKVDTALRIILTDWGFNFRNFRFRIFGCSRWMQLVKIFSNVLIEVNDSIHDKLITSFLGNRLMAFKNLVIFEITASRLFRQTIELWWSRYLWKQRRHWNFAYFRLKTGILIIAWKIYIGMWYKIWERLLFCSKC